MSAHPSGGRRSRPGEGGPRRFAVVTGASSGIGEAFARLLARQGFDLCLVARRRERLRALADEVSERHAIEAGTLAVDLADAAGRDQVATLLAERTPDLLVNNAGFGTHGPFAEQPLDGELRLLAVNVTAPFALCRAALPGMLQRRRGAIVNVSSLAGEAPGPQAASYSASKAFLTRFTESLHLELAGSGVRVQALLPGFTRTEFQATGGFDVSRLPGFVWMDAGAVAAASLRALARPGGGPICVPGRGNRALAALQAVTPRRLTGRILGAMLGRTGD